MTAVENKQRSFVQQPISPSIHRTTSLSTRRRELNPAGLSSTSNESTSAFSSASSLRSSHFISSEQPIQEQCLSPSYRSLYVANSSIQPGPGSRHYVNMCQDSLPPHQFQARSSSRENSVSDSEISTSSAASASALSESSEIRALFPAVYKQNPRMPPTQDHCYNQLKVRPGSKMSERTRQILYRPQHFESDSSSSLAESGDSLNTQDCKHREREHYNKLKLNLDNIAGNKRAIMGLKILYRDPPRGYRQMPGSSSSTRSLLQQRRPRGIFHQKITDEIKPRTRYWSEGHSNKIHSVAPDPIRSKSLSWKQEESRKRPQHLLDAVSKSPARTTPVYRTRSFSEAQSLGVMIKDKELKKEKRKSSRSTDNLSHMSTTQGLAHHTSSIGAQSQHRDVFQLRRRVSIDPAAGVVDQRCASDKLLMSSENRKSIADEMSDFDQDCTSGSISFIMSPMILKYEGEDLEYHSKEHNFIIKIPKGALKKKGTIEVQIGLAIHGPFTFPERSQSVSPILWLCSIPDTKFRKPIEVTLPHCITDARPGSLNRRKPNDGLTLQFTSASLKSGTSSKSRKRQFEFNPADGEEVFSSNDEMCGLLHTKHLNPLCIVASSGKNTELSREIAIHVSYCIIPVLPVAISGREWNIHFCITFNLHSCIQSLKNYFNELEFQLMPPHPFKFSPPSPAVPGDEWRGSERMTMECMTREPELEIRFPRELPESGWKLALESEKKISSSAISFSPCHRSDLLHSLTSSLSSITHLSPPPKFTISVDGTRTERAAVTCVSFVGSVDPVTVKVILPLNDSCTSDTSTYPPHPSRDSDYDYLKFGSTSQHLLPSLIRSHR